MKRAHMIPSQRRNPPDMQEVEKRAQVQITTRSGLGLVPAKGVWAENLPGGQRRPMTPERPGAYRSFQRRPMTQAITRGMQRAPTVRRSNFASPPIKSSWNKELDRRLQSIQPMEQRLGAVNLPSSGVEWILTGTNAPYGPSYGGWPILNEPEAIALGLQDLGVSLAASTAPPLTDLILVEGAAMYSLTHMAHLLGLDLNALPLTVGANQWENLINHGIAFGRYISLNPDKYYDAVADRGFAEWWNWVPTNAPTTLYMHLLPPFTTA